MKYFLMGYGLGLGLYMWYIRGGNKSYVLQNDITR